MDHVRGVHVGTQLSMSIKIQSGMAWTCPGPALFPGPRRRSSSVVQALRLHYSQSSNPLWRSEKRGAQFVLIPPLIKRSSSVVNEKLSRFGRIFLRVEETANLHFLVEVRTYSTKKPKRLKLLGGSKKSGGFVGGGEN